MNEPVNWAGRRFGELTPDEKARVVKAASDQLTTELHANAAEICRIMDKAITGEPSPLPEIVLYLTAFQAGEVEHGLNIDAADHPDEPAWGKLKFTSRTPHPVRLTVTGSQQARDRALYRLTSARDILAALATDDMATTREHRQASAQNRSMRTLVTRLVTAAGGPDAFSENTRRWITYRKQRHDHDQ